MDKFNLEKWLDEFQCKIKNKFSENLLFIGYHGSYRRGEATDNSDIDTVIVLKNLTINDLKRYKKIVKSMPYSEKCCGFISGEKEIKNWSKTDIFQFYYETQSLFGDIKKLITAPTQNDVKIAIKTNAEILFHGACHSFLYDENIKESLSQLYKMTFFILQAKYFVENNEYIPTKALLIENLQGKDKDILEICINRNEISNCDNKKIEELYNILISWTSSLI